MIPDWRDGLSTLSDMASTFFSLSPSLAYTDVTFTLTDKSEVSAHKIILAWASPVFEMELFGSPWNESSSDTIIVTDDRGLFRSVIHYIYSPGSLDLSTFSDMELWDMLYLANKYLIRTLTTMVEDLLMSRIKAMSYKPLLLQHFQLAKAYSIGRVLQPVISQRIQKHAKEIIASEDFLQLSLQDAVDIISFDDLRVSEGEIYEAIHNWCEKNGGENGNDVKVLFHENFQSFIKWESLSLDEFETKVLPNSSILEDSFLESLEVKRSELKELTHSRLHMKPIKSFSQTISKEDLQNQHTEWSKFVTEEFYNSRVYISIKSIRTGSFTVRLRFEGKRIISGIRISWKKLVKTGKPVLFQDCSIHGVNYLRYPFGEKEHKKFEQNFYLNENEVDSDVTITITFDNRDVLPINVLRQKNFTRLQFDKFSKVNIKSNSNFQEATDLIKQNFSLENCRVWYLKCYYPELVNDCRIIGEQIMDEYVRDIDKQHQPITNKGVFLLEESNDDLPLMKEDDILCFIFRIDNKERTFVQSTVIHRNNEYDDRKILFDEILQKNIKTLAGFGQDELTHIEYSNRPFDTSQVEMKIGNKYLVGNFSKIFVSSFIT